MDIDNPPAPSTTCDQAQSQAHAKRQASVTDEPSSLTPPSHSELNATLESGSIDRRRDKLQMSCAYCRRRKVRCDRQLPCQTCISKGIGMTCTYKLGVNRKDSATASVGERIRELEALVRSLVSQQQGPQTHAVKTGRPSADVPAHSVGGAAATGSSPPGISANTGLNVGHSRGVFTPVVSAEDDTATESNAASPSTGAPGIPGTPSEPGNMVRRMYSHNVNYISSVHWAAVLDSISELKDHYEKEKEEETRTLAAIDYMPRYSPGPRLLYEPLQVTKADILASIPGRPAVDRMVARYFNAQGVAPAFLHSGNFLREYERFWQDPNATPLAWVGLLFSILCISTQIHQLSEDAMDLETVMRAHLFRDRTVHCFVLGQFTRGGPYVLETLINNLGSELFMCKDPDNGLWLLLGVLVQTAVSQGYHRDPTNFPNISPFTGEIRRRVWAAVVQMDLRLSSQMGLPRLLKSHHCDTAEPRNLLDSDFDETTTELPPSRSETEVTPVLYSLAKNRIDRIGGLIGDLLADVTWEHPYSEIIELHQKLKAAEASLPPIFRWQPISQSFMVPPEIILYRIWLQLAIQRLVIWLHRKYLAPSYAQEQYKHSRNACLEAAIKVLEFQQLVDEETQPEGQLYPIRSMQSSMIHSVFLLGMSILCYYMQLAKTIPEVPLDRDTSAKIHGLLRDTYPMWLRSSTVSRDAREAAEHLSRLLGLGRDRQEGVPLTQQALPQPPSIPQDAAFSLDQVTWAAYQECIANIPAVFGAGLTGLDVPDSSPHADQSMTGSLFADTAEMDGWTAVKSFSGV